MLFRKIAAALFFPLCVSSAAEKPPHTLKVLCWNIHHGEGLDKKIDLERIAAVIKSHDPDVVALQEVDRNCLRSGSTDQAAKLGELTNLKSTFGEAMPYNGGSYGQAILSRYPIQSSKVVRLSENKEPRIAVVAEILHPSGTFHMVSVHLDYREADGRLAETKELLSHLSGITTPVVIAGDFNDVATSPIFSLFQDHWNLVMANKPSDTFPAEKPNKQIDHILQRGFQPNGTAVVIEEKIASDHRPIAASLSMTAK